MKEPRPDLDQAAHTNGITYDGDRVYLDTLSERVLRKYPRKFDNEIEACKRLARRRLMKQARELCK